jgi:hypothetical protein
MWMDSKTSQISTYLVSKTTNCRMWMDSKTSQKSDHFISKTTNCRMWMDSKTSQLSTNLDSKTTNCRMWMDSKTSQLSTRLLSTKTLLCWYDSCQLQLSFLWQMCHNWDNLILNLYLIPANYTLTLKTDLISRTSLNMSLYNLICDLYLTIYMKLDINLNQKLRIYSP